MGVFFKRRSARCRVAWCQCGTAESLCAVRAKWARDALVIWQRRERATHSVRFGPS